MIRRVLRCFFKSTKPRTKARKMEHLPEDELSKRLYAASEDQKMAALRVKVAAINQMREVDYVRETLHGVLSRINARESEQEHDG